MKKISARGRLLCGILCVLFLSYGYTTHAYAHGADLPKFFTINGVHTDESAFQESDIFPTAFAVAQDTASQNYMVNKPIGFSIDAKELATIFSGEKTSDIQYIWNFGDGTTGNGIENSHTYKRIGSYTLSITARFRDSNKSPQLIESVQLNIVPRKDYKLPKVVIYVNGKTTKADKTSEIKVDLNNKVKFEAITSSEDTIITYIWDLDDNTVSSNKNVSHRYKLPQYYASPSLQVRTKNGFIAFTFINIANSGKNEQRLWIVDFVQDNMVIIFLGIVALITFVIALLLRKTKKTASQDKD